MFQMSRKVFYLAFLSLAASALPAVAASFSDAQKTEIEGVVRAYLMKNPEILRDMMTELDLKQHAEEASQREKALASNQKELFDSNFQAVIGNPKGKINMVEFFDYNCAYCRHTLTDIITLIKAEPNLRVVLKDFPILGPDSLAAAEVASAARKQISGDKFLEFHQKLLTSHGHVGREQALDAAREMGLDMNKLQEDMKDPAIRAGLDGVMKLADAFNFTGTPSFVIGDEAVVGAVGLSQLKSKIDAMGKCGKTTC